MSIIFRKKTSPLLRILKLNFLLFFCLFSQVIWAQKDSSAILKEVVVRGQKSEIIQEPGKKIFQVGVNLTNLGGNLYDVLSNIPSIYVTNEGTVQYRGSQNLAIYFDGKPSGILNSSRANALSLFPADMIDRIEIISNPGAKYSAEGSSGILNIILKKEVTSESLRLNTNLGTHDKYAGSLSWARNSKKFTHFLDLNYKESQRYDYQKLYRENASPWGLAKINQEAKETNRDLNYALKWSSMYRIDAHKSLSGYLWARFAGDHNSETRFNTTTYYRTIDRLYQRESDKRGRDQGFDLNLSYQNTVIGKKDAKIDFVWINNDGQDGNDFLQNYYYENFQTLNTNFPTRIERSRAGSTNYTMLLQGDFKRNFGKTRFFEYGFKWNQRQYGNLFDYEKFKMPNWELDPKRSNNFDYLENIQAIYGNYSAKIKKFTWDLGLRMEATQLDIQHGFTKPTYVNWFPSASFLQEISEKEYWTFSLSTRISRPSYKSLNPFVSYADPINLNAGNPNLQPEKALLIELTHSKDWKNLSMSNQLFLRNVDGLVSKVRTQLEGDTTITRFENLAHSRSIGFENLLQFSIMKAWKVQVTSSVYQMDLQGFVNSLNIQEQRWASSARWNNQFKWANGWSGQISYLYQSSLLSPLGNIGAYYTIDMGIKKDYGRFTVNARVNDLTNSQITIYDSRPFGIISDLEKKKETRIYYIGISFKLDGKKKIKDLNQRKEINEKEAGDD